jgi:RNA polymerase sigma-70 factor (ECF subfamily)
MMGRSSRPNAEDADWVRAAVARFERPLARYATRLLGGDADRALDVVQDAFLKLCGQDRAVVEPYLAEWLFTVCRNRATDILRKEGRMAHLTDELIEARPGEAPPPDAAIERSEETAAVLSLLETLPRGQQEVIRLKFQEGFSYKEISRISGYSVGNVGFLIHTGLKTIRTRLGVTRPASAQA